jgi:serine/threonine protein kinase
MPHLGTLLGGKYRVVERIASGGMGVVYLAHHERLERHVAVKLVLPDKASEELAARFQREVRALGRVHSPYVAEAYDADVFTETGELYLVMEYLMGRDLRAELRARGMLSISEAATFVMQACLGAAAAHDVGVVHRDLKPQNLFLTDSGSTRRAKLVDFGIARLTTNEDPSLTNTATSLGTPLYMSPEQIHLPKTVDARSDVWALGAVLYELLAGFSAFHGATPGAVLLSITLDDPVPLQEINPAIPRELDAIVTWALTKDPGARLPSAKHFAELLGPFSVTEEELEDIAVSRVGTTRREAPPRPERKRALSHAEAFAGYAELIDGRAVPSVTIEIDSGAKCRKNTAAIRGDQRMSVPSPGPNAMPLPLRASLPPFLREDSLLPREDAIETFVRVEATRASFSQRLRAWFGGEALPGRRRVRAKRLRQGVAAASMLLLAAASSAGLRRAVFGPGDAPASATNGAAPPTHASVALSIPVSAPLSSAAMLAEVSAPPLRAPRAPRRGVPVKKAPPRSAPEGGLSRPPGPVGESNPLHL